MNNQTTDHQPETNPQPRPLYEFTRLIAMLERQEEERKAREAQRQEGKR